MQYTPKTRQQADEARLLAKGDGNFEIVSAEESWNNKCKCNMLTLNLKAWDVNGKQGMLKDWILLNEDWDWKLRHLADSVGLTDKYESGTLQAEDFEGRAGNLYITIKHDKKGEYGPQNSVREYVTIKDVTREPKASKSSVTQETNDLDDDIPF